MVYILNKHKTWIKAITVLVITAFLSQSLAWAKGPGMLMPDSGKFLKDLEEMVQNVSGGYKAQEAWKTFTSDHPALDKSIERLTESEKRELLRFVKEHKNFLPGCALLIFSNLLGEKITLDEEKVAIVKRQKMLALELKMIKENYSDGSIKGYQEAARDWERTLRARCALDNRKNFKVLVTAYNDSKSLGNLLESIYEELVTFEYGKGIEVCIIENSINVLERSRNYRLVNYWNQRVKALGRPDWKLRYVSLEEQLGLIRFINEKAGRSIEKDFLNCEAPLTDLYDLAGKGFATAVNIGLLLAKTEIPPEDKDTLVLFFDQDVQIGALLLGKEHKLKRRKVAHTFNAISNAFKNPEVSVLGCRLNGDPGNSVEGLEDAFKFFREFLEEAIEVDDIDSLCWPSNYLFIEEGEPGQITYRKMMQTMIGEVESIKYGKYKRFKELHNEKGCASTEDYREIVNVMPFGTGFTIRPECISLVPGLCHNRGSDVYYQILLRHLTKRGLYISNAPVIHEKSVEHGRLLLSDLPQQPQLVVDIEALIEWLESSRSIKLNIPPDVFVTLKHRKLVKELLERVADAVEIVKLLEDERLDRYGVDLTPVKEFFSLFADESALDDYIVKNGFSGMKNINHMIDKWPDRIKLWQDVMSEIDDEFRERLKIVNRHYNDRLIVRNRERSSMEELYVVNGNELSPEQIKEFASDIFDWGVLYGEDVLSWLDYASSSMHRKESLRNYYFVVSSSGKLQGYLFMASNKIIQVAIDPENKAGRRYKGIGHEIFAYAYRRILTDPYYNQIVMVSPSERVQQILNIPGGYLVPVSRKEAQKFLSAQEERVNALLEQSATRESSGDTVKVKPGGGRLPKLNNQWVNLLLAIGLALTQIDATGLVLGYIGLVIIVVCSLYFVLLRKKERDRDEKLKRKAQYYLDELEDYINNHGGLTLLENLEKPRRMDMAETLFLAKQNNPNEFPEVRINKRTRNVSIELFNGKITLKFDKEGNFSLDTNKLEGEAQRYLEELRLLIKNPDASCDLDTKHVLGILSTAKRIAPEKYPEVQIDNPTGNLMVSIPYSDIAAKIDGFGKFSLEDITVENAGEYLIYLEGLIEGREGCPPIKGDNIRAVARTLIAAHERHPGIYPEVKIFEDPWRLMVFRRGDKDNKIRELWIFREDGTFHRAKGILTILSIVGLGLTQINALGAEIAFLIGICLAALAAALAGGIWLARIVREKRHHVKETAHKCLEALESNAEFYLLESSIEESEFELYYRILHSAHKKLPKEFPEVRLLKPEGHLIVFKPGSKFEVQWVFDPTGGPLVINKYNKDGELQEAIFRNISIKDKYQWLRLKPTDTPEQNKPACIKCFTVYSDNKEIGTVEIYMSDNDFEIIGFNPIAKLTEEDKDEYGQHIEETIINYCSLIEKARKESRFNFRNPPYIIESLAIIGLGLININATGSEIAFLIGIGICLVTLVGGIWLAKKINLAGLLKILKGDYRAEARMDYEYLKWCINDRELCPLKKSTMRKRTKRLIRQKKRYPGHFPEIEKIGYDRKTGELTIVLAEGITWKFDKQGVPMVVDTAQSIMKILKFAIEEDRRIDCLSENQMRFYAETIHWAHQQKPEEFPEAKVIRTIGKDPLRLVILLGGESPRAWVFDRKGNHLVVDNILQNSIGYLELLKKQAERPKDDLAPIEESEMQKTAITLLIGYEKYPEKLPEIKITEEGLLRIFMPDILYFLMFDEKGMGYTTDATEVKAGEYLEFLQGLLDIPDSALKPTVDEMKLIAKVLEQVSMRNRKEFPDVIINEGKDNEGKDVWRLVITFKSIGILWIFDEYGNGTKKDIKAQECLQALRERAENPYNLSPLGEDKMGDITGTLLLACKKYRAEFPRVEVHKETGHLVIYKDLDSTDILWVFDKYGNPVVINTYDKEGRLKEVKLRNLSKETEYQWIRLERENIFKDQREGGECIILGFNVYIGEAKTGGIRFNMHKDFLNIASFSPLGSVFLKSSVEEEIYRKYSRNYIDETILNYLVLLAESKDLGVKVINTGNVGLMANITELLEDANTDFSLDPPLEGDFIILTHDSGENVDIGGRVKVNKEGFLIKDGVKTGNEIIIGIASVDNKKWNIEGKPNPKWPTIKPDGTRILWQQEREKREDSSTGGRWPFMQRLYDRIGSGWIGQALAPAFIESGLAGLVSTIVILASGLPIAMNPDMISILVIFQLLWHSLHGQKIFSRDKIIITGFSAAVLFILTSFIAPTGLTFLLLLLAGLIIPHALVNSVTVRKKVVPKKHAKPRYKQPRKIPSVSEEDLGIGELEPTREPPREEPEPVAVEVSEPESESEPEPEQHEPLPVIEPVPEPVIEQVIGSARKVWKELPPGPERDMGVYLEKKYRFSPEEIGLLVVEGLEHIRQGVLEGGASPEQLAEYLALVKIGGGQESQTSVRLIYCEGVEYQHVRRKRFIGHIPNIIVLKKGYEDEEKESGFGHEHMKKHFDAFKDENGTQMPKEEILKWLDRTIKEGHKEKYETKREGGKLVKSTEYLLYRKETKQIYKAVVTDDCTVITFYLEHFDDCNLSEILGIPHEKVFLLLKRLTGRIPVRIEIHDPNRIVIENTVIGYSRGKEGTRKIQRKIYYYPGLEAIGIWNSAVKIMIMMELDGVIYEVASANKLKDLERIEITELIYGADQYYIKTNEDGQRRIFRKGCDDSPSIAVTNNTAVATPRMYSRIQHEKTNEKIAKDINEGKKGIKIVYIEKGWELEAGEGMRDVDSDAIMKRIEELDEETKLALKDIELYLLPPEDEGNYPYYLRTAIIEGKLEYQVAHAGSYEGRARNVFMTVPAFMELPISTIVKILRRESRLAQEIYSARKEGVLDRLGKIGGYDDEVEGILIEVEVSRTGIELPLSLRRPIEGETELEKLRCVVDSGVQYLKENIGGGETLRDRVIWTGIGLKRSAEGPAWQLEEKDMYKNLVSVGRCVFNKINWQWEFEKYGDLPLEIIMQAVTDKLLDNKGEMLSQRLSCHLKRDVDLDKEVEWIWIDKSQEGAEAGVFRVEVHLKSGEKVMFGIISAKNPGWGSKVAENDYKNLKEIRRLYAEFNQKKLPMEIPEVYEGGYAKCGEKEIYMFSVEWLDNVYEVYPLLNMKRQLIFKGLDRGRPVKHWDIKTSGKIREKSIMIAATIFELTNGKIVRASFSGGDIMANTNEKGEVASIYLITIPYFCNDPNPNIAPIVRGGEIIRSTHRWIGEYNLENASLDERYLLFILSMLNISAYVFRVDDDGLLSIDSIPYKMFPGHKVVFTGITNALIRMYGEEDGLRRAAGIFEKFSQKNTDFRKQALNYLNEIKCFVNTAEKAKGAQGMRYCTVNKPHSSDSIEVNGAVLHDPATEVLKAEKAVKAYEEGGKVNNKAQIEVNGRTNDYIIIKYKDKSFVVREDLLKGLGYSDKEFLARLSSALAREKEIGYQFPFDNLPKVLLLEEMSSSPYLGANCTGDGWIGAAQALYEVRDKRSKDLLFETLLMHELWHEADPDKATETYLEEHDGMFISMGILENPVLTPAYFYMATRNILSSDNLLSHVVEKGRVSLIKMLLEELASPDQEIRSKAAERLILLGRKNHPDTGMLFKGHMINWLIRHRLLPVRKRTDPSMESKKAELHARICSMTVKEVKDAIIKFCDERGIERWPGIETMSNKEQLRQAIQWLVNAICDEENPIIRNVALGVDMTKNRYRELTTKQLVSTLYDSENPVRRDNPSGTYIIENRLSKLPPIWLLDPEHYRTPGDNTRSRNTEETRFYELPIWAVNQNGQLQIELMDWIWKWNWNWKNKNLRDEYLRSKRISLLDFCEVKRQEEVSGQLELPFPSTINYVGCDTICVPESEFEEVYGELSRQGVGTIVTVDCHSPECNKNIDRRNIEKNTQVFTFDHHVKDGNLREETATSVTVDYLRSLKPAELDLILPQLQNAVFVQNHVDQDNIIAQWIIRSWNELTEEEIDFLVALAMYSDHCAIPKKYAGDTELERKITLLNRILWTFINGELGMDISCDYMITNFGYFLYITFNEDIIDIPLAVVDGHSIYIENLKDDTEKIKNLDEDGGLIFDEAGIALLTADEEIDNYDFIRYIRKKYGERAKVTVNVYKDSGGFCKVRLRLLGFPEDLDLYPVYAELNREEGSEIWLGRWNAGSSYANGSNLSPEEILKIVKDVLFGSPNRKHFNEFYRNLCGLMAGMDKDWLPPDAETLWNVINNSQLPSEWPGLVSAMRADGIINNDDFEAITAIGKAVEQANKGGVLDINKMALLTEAISIRYLSDKADFNKPFIEKLRCDLTDLGYGSKVDWIIVLLRGLKRELIEDEGKFSTRSDYNFIKSLEEFLRMEGEIFREVRKKRDEVRFDDIKRNKDSPITKHWTDIFDLNLKQWDVLNLAQDKHPEGVILQNITDLGPGIQNWLEGIKRYNIDMSKVTMAYIIDDKVSEEERKKLFASKPDNVILTTSLEEIQEEAGTSNIVYRASSENLRRYKNQSIKLVEKGNAGPVIELSWCLLMLATDDIQGAYEEFLEKLVSLGFLTREEIRPLKDPFYVELPKIESVLKMWNELQEGVSPLDIWA